MLLFICIALVVFYFLVDWLIHLPKVDGYRNKYVFVTGCDSGFGRDLVIQLDKLGFPVFAGCLTKTGHDYLRSTCSIRLVTLTVDVTDNASIQSAYKTIHTHIPKDGVLWAVVNNAGVTGKLSVSEMCTRKDYSQACEVNLFGPIEVSRVFMPLLRKSKGRLVNMVSVMGRCPTVSGPYSVSKFGMEAFSDVLRREVAPFGVKVVVIEPGFFKTTLFNTEFVAREFQNWYDQSSDEVREAYGKDYVSNSTNVFKGICTTLNEDTDKVIDAYIQAITAKYPKARYLVGFDAKFIYVPLYHLPEWLMDLIIEKRSKHLANIGSKIKPSK
ncbi:retinol dehydrogenase 2-like isoform X1 [Biomphalaria glabrata]|uniref:Retinol dehydrogenase 16-like isoform X1 n=1 Tax=Biomphalaria glabrata TaxID=6526 RepID=A0A2C9JS21_BIOGL|nr:retinol dehydrogenase 16-like isoform X1 [Biomphalaria glabrata]XP_013079991.1 retinol dehydrogenase 16-like isoform X1 [Biomphalaria glabrata]XP_013079992.1 retinol dehydrogenase 16-like isoform X1 [Biomphalaria glabrata]XP_055860661.1 retinol dehydrogenase 16-like isoform X1 [Biomphalaria glabrata]KAI8743438.1 retinol dehydrogenase 2-like isoform X1 [Biomphalaria glabrata]